MTGTSTIYCGPGRVRDLYEAKELVQDHWEESVSDALKERMPLDPDWEALKKLEDSGMLQVVTAVDATQPGIVGYSIIVFGMHLHSRNVIVATVDCVHMDRAVREQSGATLLRFTFEAARERGAHLVVWQCCNPYLGSALLDLGYKPLQTSYVMEVE